MLDTTGSGATESKDGDDTDLFGEQEEEGEEEEESEEAMRLSEKQLVWNASKEAKKPRRVPKSHLTRLEPWDDETHTAKLEDRILSIRVDGSNLLPWGTELKSFKCSVSLTMANWGHRCCRNRPRL